MIASQTHAEERVPESAVRTPTTLAASPIVVVLSWDGMRHDYLDMGRFPALARMAQEGVRADRLLAVLPSSTFPGHVSMATGTYPDRHGIVDNVFVDAQRGRYAYSSDADWIDAEPVWIAAQRQGVKTATYFWVGSETDWRGMGTSYRIAPFDGARPEAHKVDQILEWLRLPEGTRPRLIMSYWAGADSVGHERGPDSAAVIEQIQSQDLQLGRLLLGIDELNLWSRTTLIIVSDHGMAPWTRVLNINQALLDEGIAADATGATVVQIHLEATVGERRMRDALGRILADVPGAVIHQRQAVPASYRLDRPGRMGEWMVVLPPPFAATRAVGLEYWGMRLATTLGWSFGMHGYDPSLSHMGAIFLALGRDVPANLGEVRQIDLAATIAKLLSISPPKHSEGKPMW